MDIQTDILKLLKSEGYRLNEPIKDALDEFMDIVEDENSEMDSEYVDPMEDEEEEEDAA